jgi:ricin-type beta-trefoil lectin protein
MRTRKRIAGLFSVGAAAVLLATGLAAPANAGTSQVDVVNVHIKNQLTNKCVAIGGGSLGVVQAIQFTCGSGTEQQWNEEFVGFDIYDNPMYRFRRIGHNDLCLQADPGKGGKVVQRACSSSNNQLWSNNNAGRLRNVGSTYCLAVPGGSPADAVGLIAWTCTAGGEQKWDIY